MAASIGAPEAVVSPRVARWNIFLCMVTFGALAPNLPAIRADFGVSYTAAGWVLGTFAAARVVADVTCGSLARRLGLRSLLIAGTVAVLAGCLISAASIWYPLFLVGRAVAGVGSAITTTVGLSVVLSASGPGETGRASGRFHSALAAGAVVGPGFGGLVAGWSSWRIAIALAGSAAGLSLLGMVRSERITREATEREGSSPAITGSREGLAALRILAYATTISIFFVRGSIQQTLAPLRGVQEVGMSTQQVALVLMIGGVMVSTLGPVVGGLGDRFGPARLCVTSGCLLAVGSVAAGLVDHAAVFALALAVVAIGTSASGLPSSIVVGLGRPEERTRSIGRLRTWGDVAMFTGPVAAGAGIDHVGFAATGMATGAAVGAGLLLSYAYRTVTSRATVPVAPAVAHADR